MTQNNDQDWRRIASVFFSTPKTKAPPYFANRVMAHIRERSRSREARVPIWKWLASSAGLLVINAYLLMNSPELRHMEEPSLVSFTEGRGDLISEFLTDSTPVDDLAADELGWEEI